MLRLLIAGGFGLIYSLLYPILIGGFVIYHHPPLTAVQALAYLGCGVLLQLVLMRKPLRAQLGAGILHLALLLILPGGFYQS